MSTYYKNKSNGFVLCLDYVSEGYVCATLPGEILARLELTSDEFKAQFEPYNETTLLGLSPDDNDETFYISIQENRVPEEFGAPVWRNLRLTVGYDEILSVMRDRIVDAATGALAYPPKE